GVGCVPEPAHATLPTGDVDRTPRQESSSDPLLWRWLRAHNTSLPLKRPCFSGYVDERRLAGTQVQTTCHSVVGVRVWVFLCATARPFGRLLDPRDLKRYCPLHPPPGPFLFSLSRQVVPSGPPNSTTVLLNALGSH
ncbi:unnamed protein product, partial [Ectocarpus sp. 4 AP-2014]